MSHIFRVFIRHESDAQPAYIKVRSELEPEVFLKELEDAMQQPAPSVWRCVDWEDHVWLFRADKIYTACIYPPEDEVAELEPGIGTSVEVAAVPTAEVETAPVADAYTYDDLDAVAAQEGDGATEENS